MSVEMNRVVTVPWQPPVKLPGLDVPILMYHHLVTGEPVPGRFEISVRQFETQMDWLCQHNYTNMTVAKLLHALREGHRLPLKVVVVTFDDAYTSFIELALPALSRRQMTATVYVPVGRIGEWNVWDRDQGYPERRIMDATQIRETVAAGIELGSHGWDHLNLRECSPTQLEREVGASRDELQHMTGVVPLTFSYPYGQHAPLLCDRLDAAGYIGAVSIFSTEPYVTNNPFAMRRIYPHEGDTLRSFRLKLSPAYLWFKAWREIGYRALLRH